MISVIICTYNRCQSLKKTLESLAHVSVPTAVSWELIVVDNNSSDDTPQAVQTFATESGLSCRYILERNRGLSHARNAGIKEAKGDIIAFTDDDVTVGVDWLCQLQSVFDQFGCMGVGGKIVAVWTSPKPSWFETDGPYALMRAILSLDLGEEPCEMHIPPFGANMAFKKVAFEKHGFFRTDLGKSGKTLMTGEDTEFGRRLLCAGDQLMYAPKAVVYHPVEKERTKKRYFESWYFNYGRYSVRIDGFPERTVRYFGVPRYLFRSLLTSFSKWAFSFGSQRRFHHKLDLCRCLGEITEAYRTSIKGN
jgi:glycosyltransferase involved in cell wall biosynthesis